jgi:hypothetical protein
LAELVVSVSTDPPDDLFVHELKSALGKYYALKEARQKHPYEGDLIRVLLPYPEGLRRSLAIYELEKQRKQDGLPIPPSFGAAVQNAYNHYSEDSEVFRARAAKREEALFHSPGGKGSGRWALHRDRALRWLTAKLGEPKLF